jgi:prolyl oligopeptidase
MLLIICINLDLKVYHTPDHEDYGFAATVSEDGRYLVIQVWKGKKLHTSY